jgi:hypothetical protein
MAKQKTRLRLVQKQHSPKSAHAEDKATQARRTASVLDIGGRSVKAQAARLGDRQVSAVQRQTVATQIARAQGNLHVQRLVGVVQRQGGASSWVRRVRQARKKTVTRGARDQAFRDLIAEALKSQGVTVRVTTNSKGTLHSAAASKYAEAGPSFQVVNFDRKLAAKIRPSTLWGIQYSYLPKGAQQPKHFIVLGPRALNEIGPQYTQMAYEHELAHAQRRRKQWLTTKRVAHAGPVEELEIYTDNFVKHILGLVTVDTAACKYGVAEMFPNLFANYRKTPRTARDRAFKAIETFYTNSVKTNPTALLKFKLWLQSVLNKRSLAKNPLATRINGLSGLGLDRRDSPMLLLFVATFTQHFPSLVTFDVKKGAWNITTDFLKLFDLYTKSSAVGKTTVHTAIQNYYTQHVKGDPTNLIKFKIWLQRVINAKGAGHALVKEINALPGLNLKRGPKPHTHIPRSQP